jgi:SagB-type dehydrogenase family enzyme
VWSAYGTTGTVPVTAADGTRYELARRPYPSGGQKYPAQLRLIALDVAGLEPGCYDADPLARALSRIGPAPSGPDLEAASIWFGAKAAKLGGVDIAELPALLGLSVRLPATRTGYGLRGLRLALVEAGHLAQNLALVAAASGLSLGMIGGFYDDLAHEVFGLDGVDDHLMYLLPVGRRA